MRLCFATNNSHKLDEIRALASGHFEIVGLKEIGCNEELPEDQLTLEGNSLQKANYVFTHYGVACFADDTGLEVEALDGKPGVFSARYAGDQKNSMDNIRLLLQNLRGQPHRKARFRTVISLIWPAGTRQFEGMVEGQILERCQGEGGFGYDPVFLPSGHSKSMAEMTREEKNAISHRGQAFIKLATFLASPDAGLPTSTG